MIDRYVNIRLPSKCIPYEIDPNTVSIRSFIGEDAELMASISEKNMLKKFVQVIDRTLKGIKTSQLTVGDYTYIMLWQAVSSYSGKVTQQIVCEHCFKEFHKQIDLDQDLDSVDLPDDFDVLNIFQISEEVYPLRLLTLGDEMILADLEEAGKPTNLYETALCLENGKSVEENLEILRDMPVKDIHELQEFHRKFDHGPTMIFKYDCPSCKNGGEAVLPFRLETLFSF